MTQLNGLKVLVVDDERFIRITVKAMLRGIGQFIVEEAASGEAALDALPAFRPDIVLCDVGMTPIGGLEFVERLRVHADAALRATRVVMISGTDATMLDAAKLGIDGYLVKPVARRELEEQLTLIFKDRQVGAGG